MRSEIQIHGDNIVECERALDLIERALGEKAYWMPGSEVTHPIFELPLAPNSVLQVQLLPGHNRWGVGLSAALQARGATLREGADAVLTRKTGSEHELLVGLEFCGALPAGNNAWQRHGRALAFAQAEIPYLIFAEVGGLELTADRETKASRFPNPAVPFALIQATRDHSVPVAYVYEPAPSAPPETRAIFGEAFGRSSAIELLRCLLLNQDPNDAIDDLQARALSMVRLLSNSRRTKDSLVDFQWGQVLEAPDRFSMLSELAPIWSRREGSKVASSDTAPLFTQALVSAQSRAMHSASLPISWIPASHVKTFLESLEDIYGDDAMEIVNTVDTTEPLVVVLVTGFKPRGDDSRPDRGLMPLARMLAGPNAQVLTFIWGPAKPRMLEAIKRNIDAVARENGLIEAARAVSDFVWIDSVNAPAFGSVTVSFDDPPKDHSGLTPPELMASSEHDIDAVMHFVMTQPSRPDVFEGMCNPPGGDWSGVSLVDALGREVRWTSLPRVSASGAKRPDHVLQCWLSTSYILSVESKHLGRDMESEVGPALIRYLTDLMKAPPNVSRLDADSPWIPCSDFDEDKSWQTIYSVATFKWIDERDLRNGRSKAQADLAVAWEIMPGNDQVTAHVHARSGTEFLASDFEQLCAQSLVRVVVQKY